MTEEFDENKPLCTCNNSWPPHQHRNPPYKRENPPRTPAAKKPLPPFEDDGAPTDPIIEDDELTNWPVPQPGPDDDIL
jgi:hypothetical protein